MLDSGTQIILCNLPIRFDTYKGCSHGCEYCFANQRGKNINKISKNEGPKALKSFIDGKRSKKTKWCDWNIPIHWGGMSDPFQPIESKYRISLECLNIFKQENYPFVFSTKGAIIAEKEYLRLLKDCNSVGQISIISPANDKIEKGAPPYYERLKILKKISDNTRRSIVRIQPYILENHDFLLSKGLVDFKNAGAHGIIVEGIKYHKKKDGFEKIAGDYVYPENVLLPKLYELKKIAHKIGLSFFCGENRFRGIGDSLTCCGCEGVDGFKVNKANLNELFHGSGEILYTKHMENEGTGACFGAFIQSWELGQKTYSLSYKKLMSGCAQVVPFMKTMGRYK